jgi:hypothetical protein
MAQDSMRDARKYIYYKSMLNFFFDDRLLLVLERSSLPLLALSLLLLLNLAVPDEFGSKLVAVLAKPGVFVL